MAGRVAKKGVATNTVKPMGTKGSVARAVVAPAVNKHPKAKNRVANSTGKTAPLKKPGLDKVVRELQVRLAELETQNEDLHRTQEQLQASQTRYFDLYDIAPVGYFSVSEKGIILEANITGANLLGAVPSDMRAQRFFNFIYEEDQDLFQQHRNKLFETRLPQACEMRMVRKDGSLIWVLVEGIVAKDARSGKAVCLATMSDITRQKKAEESLHHERDRAQGYLDTVETIIVSLNTEGMITAINRKGCQLFGYREDEIIGQLWFSTCLPQPDGMDNVYPYFLKLITGELEAAEYFENPIITRSGELREIAWHNALLRDEKGQIIGTLSSGDDITERKKVEEALRASEEKYHTVADFTYDWEYWMSPEGSYIYVSPSCKLHTGYEPEAFLQNPDLMLKIIHPEDRDILISHRKESFDSHKISNTLDFRIITLNGEEHWISHRCQKVYSRDGKFLGVRGSNRDITKRKLSERALAESETRYRELFENANLSIFKSTLEGRALAVNPEFARMFGYESPEEVIATVKDIATDLFADPHHRGEIALLKKDNPDLNTFEVLYRRKDRSTFWGKLTIRMIADSDGTCFFEGFIDDITEHKQAEEALQESEAQYRLLADNTTDGIWLLDMNLKLMYCSPSSQKQSGFTLQEIMEMSLEQYFTPESLKVVAEVFLEEIPKIQAYSDYNPILTLDLEFYKKDGTAFWAESKFSVIRDKSGNPVSILAVARDITERKLAQIELLRAIEMSGLAQKAAGSGAWDWDISTGQLNWSPELFNIFGLDQSKESPSFEIWRALLHPEDRQQAEERINEAVHDHTKLYNQYRIILSSGEIRWIDAWGNTMYDDRGEATRMLGICVDVTDRKKAEETLRVREAQYNLLSEHTSDTVWLMDMDLNITYHSPSVEKLRGYTAQEIIGMPLDKHVTPESLKVAAESYLNEMSRVEADPDYNPILTFELEYTCKDGSTVWTENKFSVIRDENGNPASILGEARDITDRRKTDELLRKSEAQYRLLADHTTDFVVLMDMDLNPLYQSPSAEKHTGLTHKELMELPVEKRIVPESLKVAAEMFLEELPKIKADLDYNPILTLDLEIFRADGTTLWSENKFSVIRDENRNPISILGEARDITERRSAEEKLLKSYESLKKTLNDAINTMVKIVELRDPYTAGHQQKVADLATAIARAMKLEDSQVDQIRTAAVIHDIGKMYVPSDILSKPGKLSNIEFGLIKTHSQSGYNIVKGMDLPSSVADAILQHHERLDGSGYPAGLKGEDMILEAKILSVADVIEAMASHRPYRSAPGLDKALEEISNNRGKLYDPDVVDACLELFRNGQFEFKSM
jgi:PAS domain S-box-containing protein/putative nucleotidyltransferase with HDIG domain